MEAPSAGSSENPSEQKEFSEAVASLQASDHRENREDILSVIRAASTERVLLNIGGYKYETTLSTLGRRGENFFTKMILENAALNVDTYWIDRDGQYFAPILEYLRTGDLVIPPGMSVLSVEREARSYGIELPPEFLRSRSKSDPTSAPQLRDDGIYLTRLNKIVPGFMLFGPEGRFFHQTTNPLHTYTRRFRLLNNLIQWSMGGLANEEMHAVVTGDTILLDTPYYFVPFREPSPGAVYRILNRKDEDSVNPEIVDALSDDNYRKVKFQWQGKTMPIAEIQFVNKSKAIVKVVAKQFGGYEIIQLQDVPLESSNLLGVPVYRFNSEEFSTGMSLLGTKITKRYQVDVMCFGDFILVRSLTVEFTKSTTKKDSSPWVAAADTQFQEIFILFARRPPTAPLPP